MRVRDFRGRVGLELGLVGIKRRYCVFFVLYRVVVIFFCFGLFGVEFMCGVIYKRDCFLGKLKIKL